MERKCGVYEHLYKQQSSSSLSNCKFQFVLKACWKLGSCQMTKSSGVDAVS